MAIASETLAGTLTVPQLLDYVRAEQQRLFAMGFSLRGPYAVMHDIPLEDSPVSASVSVRMGIGWFPSHDIIGRRDDGAPIFARPPRQ